ncbi:MAG TPA: extracellular solute-binding protein, partial [Glycomyces sp.]|nr:extracellular solute-binding protein [Glycomyces sp.]
MAWALWLAAAALGCGAGGPGAGGSEAVRVVSWADYRELQIDQEILDSFRVRHPEIPVVYESLEGSGIYREKVLTSIAAGTPPGVFLLDGIDLPAFVNRGVVLDLAPFAARVGVDLSVFHPRLVELFRDGRGLWAFPKDFTPMVIYYNRDAFDEAGVPYPRPGWTWAEFLETAKRLTRDTDGDGE